MTTTVRYGRTGVDVTPIAIGTSGWGSLVDGVPSPDRDARASELALAFASQELPVTFLDTSNEYGSSRSEALIGRALAAVGGLAPGLVVQTKLDRDLETDSFSGDRMRKSLEESLERLGLDDIQVLHLHDPDNIGFEAAMAPGGPVEALVAMKESGVARAIGISGGPVDLLQRFVETDLFDALVTHNRYTLIDRSGSALLDAAAARDVGVTNAAPFGGGILTGDPRFAGSYGYRAVTPEVEAAVGSMRRLCDEAGVPLAAAALQFSLRESRVHSTIVGVSSRGRLEGALADADLHIPADLWPALDEVAPHTFALDA